MRILSLSDIHYKPAYDNNEIVQQYIASFKTKIEEINSKQSIDLVLLNGDIAYSGQNKEYKSFFEIINSVIPNSIPILSIVGNHDVNWKSLKAALDSADKDLSTIYDIEDIYIENNLKNPKGLYRSVFENFYDNFAKELQKFRPQAIDVWSSDFCEKRYCGYAYNKNEKVLILLLNSSWYSFGSGVLQSFYQEKIVELKNADSIAKFAADLIDGRLTQMGKQSYFFSFFPFKKEIRQILADTDVKVITAAHHPPSWLRWKEQYETEVGKTYNLDRILDKTNLLITGHIHSPILEPLLMQQGCYHYSNGAFMEYDIIDRNSDPELAICDPNLFFPNNWFTIIDFTTHKFNYQSYKFFAESKDSIAEIYEYKWLLTNNESKNYFLQEKPRFSKPSENSKKSITTDTSLNFQHYFPSDTIEVTKLIYERRNNSLKHLNGKLPIIVNKFYGFEFGEIASNTYHISFNSIKELHNVILSANNFETLRGNKLIGEMYDILLSSELGLVPTFAFYEFFYETTGRAFLTPTRLTLEIQKQYEILENQSFLYFQAFKHLFFNKFEELYRFKELNIVFDCFLV